MSTPMQACSAPTRTHVSFLTMCLAFAWIASSATGPAIRVGVHEAPPLVTRNSDGHPKGLLVDILEGVAKDYGRPLEYTFAPVPALLAELGAERLDMVAAVGSTELRASAFDLSEPAFESPTEVYVVSGVEASTLSDLAGKRIAVAETDGHAETVQAQLSAYGLAADVVVVPDYASVAVALETGRADAGVVTQQSRAEMPEFDAFVRTSIPMSPVSIRIAFPKGRNRALLYAINDRLEQATSDDFSPLNRAMMRWMGDTLQGYAWRMFRRLLIVSTLAIAALVVLLIALRMRIQQKTRELRVANEHLRESEEYFRSLIENSLEIILIFDEKFVIHYVSPSVETVLGYTPEEVLGTQIWEHVHPDDVAMIMAVHETSLQNPGVPNWSEFRARHKNGRWRYLESIGNNLLHHSVVGGIVVNCRDVTERKEAETLMRQQARIDAFMRDIGTVLTQSDTLGESVQRCVDAAMARLGLASACVWTLDSRGDRLNPIATAGSPLEERPGTPIALGQPPVGMVAQQRRPFVTNAVLDEPFLRNPDRLRDAGVCAFAAYPMLIEQSLVGVAAYYHTAPLSEMVLESLATATRSMAVAIRRGQAEAALKESEERFRALVEHAPEAIIVIDHATGRFEDVNENAVKLFGVDRATLLGMNPSQLSPEVQPDGTPSVIKFVEKMDIAMRGGTPVFEWTHRDVNGREIDCEVRLLRLPAGDRQLVRGSITDITERKQAEKVLENYRATLENEVTARTEELAEKNSALERTLQQLRDTQDQLVVNQKMASLGALTAGIAHEIKNPLNFVNNFADLTAELVDELEQAIDKRMVDLDDKTRQEVRSLLADMRQNTRKISEHGKRADSIVRGMLLHSRGKSGERQPTDLNALLDEYVHLAYHGMRAQDSAFNIAIETDYDPKVGSVEVVPQDLSRVFLNLINNACYAAHERKIKDNGAFEPKLWVASRDLGSQVEIRVRDNGAGMPKEIRDRVFEPFFTTKPAGRGTGLGLSISYDIVVQEHHGELQVESRPGEFTEFKMLLPRHGQEMRAPQGAPHA